jgi:predicted O-linked N-acetylglucosamine transferase (SPINDLY family)
LSVIGCSELIAETAEGYADKAIALAHHRPRLNAYRTTIRDKMQRSPLLDRASFVAKLERAYHDAWRTWCIS